jgi:hypothetical protein
MSISCKAQKQSHSEFSPQGYVVYKKHYGDLNKDGLEDCVIIIKEIDKNNIVINRFEKKVDRNRRGIIVLINKKEGYELALKNYNCFSSENEDGGVYYAPQLSVEIKHGDLIINYNHGRYGFWGYSFRYQNSKLELIEYNSSSNYGPIINIETNINFLTKKKLIKENTNENSEGGDEIFKETWIEIKINSLINLSEIKDFEELDLSIY